MNIEEIRRDHLYAANSALEAFHAHCDAENAAIAAKQYYSDCMSVLQCLTTEYNKAKQLALIEGGL